MFDEVRDMGLAEVNLVRKRQRTGGTMLHNRKVDSKVSGRVIAGVRAEHRMRKPCGCCDSHTVVPSESLATALTSIGPSYGSAKVTRTTVL